MPRQLLNKKSFPHKHRSFGYFLKEGPCFVVTENTNRLPLKKSKTTKVRNIRSRQKHEKKKEHDTKSNSNQQSTLATLTFPNINSLLGELRRSFNVVDETKRYRFKFLEASTEGNIKESKQSFSTKRIYQRKEGTVPTVLRSPERSEHQCLVWLLTPKMFAFVWTLWLVGWARSTRHKSLAE